MKNIKRLEARLALKKLRESNAWIVRKSMRFVEADMDLEKGSLVTLGATKDGELALKNGSAVVVIADDELISKVVDAVTSADALSDVEFYEKDALDAALDGKAIEDIISELSDEGKVEEPEVSVDDETVEEKAEKIGACEMAVENATVIERVEIAEEDGDVINLGDVSMDTIAKEDVADYETFKGKVSELGGSIQPGVKELALNAEGKVIGYFDTETSNGVIYPEETFGSEEEVTGFDPAPTPAIAPAIEGDEPTLEAVEESLKAYEESNKSGKDLLAMVEGLEKAGLTESKIAEVAGSFTSRKSFTEGVEIFDRKLGTVVSTMKESVEANNWIEESEVADRFSKRFFA